MTGLFAILAAAVEGYYQGNKELLILFMTILTQAFFTLVGSNFMAFSLFTARHDSKKFIGQKFE
jgi:hypothetical protein